MVIEGVEEGEKSEEEDEGENERPKETPMLTRTKSNTRDLSIEEVIKKAVDNVNRKEERKRALDDSNTPNDGDENKHKK